MNLGFLYVLLILNAILALFYLLWGILHKRATAQRRSRVKYVMLTVVMLLCPVMGPCFLTLSHLIYRLITRRTVDMGDVSFSRAKSKNYVAADWERDINIVPMPEALVVVDVSRRRKMLLDILKRDMKKSLGTMAAALSNPDSETAHYAASVLMDALSEFRGNIQNILSNLKKDPKNADLALLLLDSIGDVLRQKILSGDEKKAYVYTLDNAGDLLFEHAPTRLDGVRYGMLLNALVEIRDFSAAEKWAKRALSSRPDELDVYTGCMKLYFTYGDCRMFFDTLNRLRESGITVDNKTMELIRIYGG